MRYATHVAAVAVCCFASTRPTRLSADESASNLSFDLDMEACPGVVHSVTKRIVSMELQGIDARNVELTVRVRCSETQLEIHASNRRSQRSATRTLDLTLQPGTARSRLVALALVELYLHDLRPHDLRASTETGAALEKPPRTREARESQRENIDRQTVQKAANDHARHKPLPTPRRPQKKQGRFGIDVRPLAAVFSGTGSPELFGGGLRFWHHFAPSVAWSVATDALIGRQSTLGIGQLHMHTISLSPALYGHLGGDTWRVFLGGGSRVGFVFAKGQPNAPAVGRKVRGSWWGPFAIAESRLLTASGFVFRWGVEAGYVLGSYAIRVDAEDQIAFAGAWVSTFVAIGMMF